MKSIHIHVHSMLLAVLLEFMNPDAITGGPAAQEVING
jgi:hypothetical protein